MPTPAEQRLLEIPPAAAALAIDRLGHAGGRPVEWRHTLIRGDRFSLVAEFSARTGYQLSLGSAYPGTRTPASVTAATA
jgi:GntR family transcriptional regulator